MILRNILGTSGTRILNAISGLVVLWIAANELGAEAWGISGIILLDISLILLIVDLMSSTLVYFTPRHNLKTLMLVAYGWSISVTLLAGLIFLFLSMFPSFYATIVPAGYGMHILILVLLNSVHSFNMGTLLGQGRIVLFNSLFSLQFVLMLLSMASFVYVAGIHDERAFVYALYVSYSLPALIGLLFILKGIQKGDNLRFWTTAKEMLSFGSVMQLSGIVHLLNKRLSFFVIKHISGYGAVGIYNSGTQLTEGLRLIGQSISLVQYSNISNSSDPVFTRRISLQLLKFSVILTTFALLVLIAVPRHLFELLLSKDFGDIRMVIVSLAPGVIALSANTIFSHYFSGTGKPKYNLIAALIGLGITIPLVFILIPAFGLVGAGLSASAAYIVTVVYQWIIFKKLTSSSLHDIWLTRSDIREFYMGIRALLKR